MQVEGHCKELEASAAASGGKVPMTTVCSGIHSLEPNTRLSELPLETLKGHLDQLRADQIRLMQVWPRHVLNLNVSCSSCTHVSTNTSFCAVHSLYIDSWACLEGGNHVGTSP